MEEESVFMIWFLSLEVIYLIYQDTIVNFNDERKDLINKDIAQK